MSAETYLSEAILLARQGNRENLAQELGTIRKAIGDLRTRNAELQRKCDEFAAAYDELQKKYDIPSRLVFAQGVYLIVDDPLKGGAGKTAICPACWSDGGKVVRQVVEKMGNDFGFTCYICRRTFVLKKEDKTYMA